MFKRYRLITNISLIKKLANNQIAFYIIMYYNVITLSDIMIKERKYTTITIPKPLFEKIQKRIGNTGFSSVSDYVTYILRESIVDMEQKNTNSSIKKKLSALGYI